MDDKRIRFNRKELEIIKAALLMVTEDIDDDFLNIKMSYEQKAVHHDSVTDKVNVLIKRMER